VNDNFALRIQQLWQQSCESYRKRILIIQKTVTALQQGKLTTEQQHQAEREAHTLIGSLGSFGLSKATDISRQIQEILQQEKLLEIIKAEELELLVQQLQQCIEVDGLTASSLATSVYSRLLIIDNDIVFANQIATEAITKELKAQIAIDSEQAQKILADGGVDIILLNLDFQKNIAIGLKFLANIRSLYSDITIVIITQDDAFTTRLEVARLGIRYFLQKPIATAQILASLTQVLQKKHHSLYRLLVIDDDPGILQIVEKILSPYGYQITLLDQPLKFWETLESTNPDLLILDVELFTGEKINNTQQFTLNGFDLCQVIRSDLRWNRLPILFLSAHTDVETIQNSFAVGASDFLNKPIVAKELQTRVRTRLEQQQIWKLTEVDELTGVSLRSKALQDLTILLQKAQRQQQPLSLAMMDLDSFKSINDKYGHQVGDRVLSYLGQLLNQSFHRDDVVGRWGGEEFVVGMYGLSGQVSRERLMQVLQKLQQHSFTTSEGVSFHVTFSGGIAQFPNDGQDVQTLFQVADVALYKAKQQGRNQVLLSRSA
jgi:diguanylate cyclase (GGDEF)-like protein